MRDKPQAFAARLVRLIFDRDAQLWLTPVMARALRPALVVLAASLAAASLGLALPMVTRQLIDTGIMAGDTRALLVWSAVGFALGLGAIGLGIGNSMLHMRASARMLADLRGRVFAASLARDPLHPEPPLGEAMARADGDCAEIQSFAFDTLLVAVGSIFRLAGGLGLMLALDWRLALLPLVAAPAELWFLARARPRTRQLAAETRDLRGAVSSDMAEALSARRTLRLIGATGQRSAGFATLQHRQIGALIRQRLWSETVSAVSQALTTVMRATVLLIGGWQVMRGEWQIGTLVAFLAYAGMISAPLRNLLGLYHAQARARVASARLGEVFALARPDTGRDLPQAPLLLELCEARAGGASHPPLSASIPPGSRVLIDGPSGIGKSRLMSLLLRDAPAASGQVRVAGHDVMTIAPSQLCRRIAHLTQSPVILRGTLGENLRLAALGASDAAIWRALEQADLAPWARGMQGLATPLHEAGRNLSGGMIQRIALARALLRPADILIFDEAFSEIDEASCHRILARIEEDFAGRTRIFLAHSGPAREGPFDQRITLSSTAPIRLSSRGGAPYQRENAREKAV